MGVGSVGKGVRERLMSERSNLRFELVERRLDVGGEGRGYFWIWMKFCCA